MLISLLSASIRQRKNIKPWCSRRKDCNRVNPSASMFRTRAIRSSSGRNYHFLYLIAIPRTLFLFLRRPAISGQRSRSFFFPCPQPEAFYKHTRQRVSTSYKGKSLPLHEEIENIILNHIPPITKDAFSKRMSGEQTWILNQQH
jgi:hypothetical protein